MMEINFYMKWTIWRINIYLMMKWNDFNSDQVSLKLIYLVIIQEITNFSNFENKIKKFYLHNIVKVTWEYHPN